MSNLGAIRRQLFGAPTPRQRAAKPYDHLTKAQLWEEIASLRFQLAAAHVAATIGKNSIGTLGTEGTPAFRMLTGARAALREVASLTAERPTKIK